MLNLYYRSKLSLLFFFKKVTKPNNKKRYETVSDVKLLSTNEHALRETVCATFLFSVLLSVNRPEAVLTPNHITCRWDPVPMSTMRLWATLSPRGTPATVASMETGWRVTEGWWGGAAVPR